MTLVEFIAPLKEVGHREKVLAVLYYEKRYRSNDVLTAEKIHRQLIEARVPKAAKINVHDVLAKSGHYVDMAGFQGSQRLWALTSSGEQHVRKLLSLPAAEPELEHDVSSLMLLVKRLPDADVRSYIEEAVTCLRVGALRACVVFLWSGAIRAVQQKLLDHGAPAVNAAITKHDPKARAVAKLDDFAYVKDNVTLLAAQDLGVIDKTQKTILGQGLDLRNACGHPSQYTVGPKKASSFIEDAVGIVFA